MRIVFMGTPEFAVPSLTGLVAHGMDVCLVVTRPDARQGRGRTMGCSAVKHCAMHHGLMVYQPERLSSASGMQLLNRLAPDLGIVVAYGEVLSAEIISAFPRGLFNVHASLLPKYRGAAPIHHALLCGETTTGVTVQRVVPRLDAGPVLLQTAAPIRPHDNAGTLHDRLAELGAQGLVDVMTRRKRGEHIAETEQDESLACYAPKVSKQDGRICWTADAAAIHNLVRAMTPHPGAFCRFQGRGREETVTVLATECNGPGAAGDAPGSVVSAEQALVVAAGDGRRLRILSLKPAGGRAMDAADFIRGHHAAPGDRFV